MSGAEADSLEGLIHAARRLLEIERSFGIWPDVVPGVVSELPPAPERGLPVRESRAPAASAAPAVLREPAERHESNQAARAEAGAGAEDERRRRTALLDPIAEEVAACARCPLHGLGRTRTVFGVGDPCARLLFIGEGPGQEEDRRGEPFVGPAGRLLDDIIRAMHLTRESVYIANVVKCRPPQNRNPQPEEVVACRSYLDRQIEIIRPEAICLLGSVAAKAVLGGERGVGALRGRFHEYLGIPVRVTYHPAYLLRQPGDKRKTWEDVQTIMRLLGL